MKVNYHDLLSELDSLDRFFSVLVTIAEGSTKWESVPNSEMEIMRDRIKSINDLSDDLCNLFEKYPI